MSGGSPPSDASQRRQRRQDESAPASQSASKPTFGNFRRYYHIRNPGHNSEAGQGTGADDVAASFSTLDPRVPAMLAFLERHFAVKHAAWRGPNRVLDIGCNSGKVTTELAQGLAISWSQSSTTTRIPELVLGVDADPGLIAEAQYAAGISWSQCRPPPQAMGDEVLPLSDQRSFQYFPACFPYLYGPLPYPLSVEGASSREPRSKKRKVSPSALDASSDTATELLGPAPSRAFSALRFIAAEWVRADLDADGTREPKDGAPAPETEASSRHGGAWQRSLSTASMAVTLQELSAHERAGFDVIVCLAVTKWIHVHQGDGGLTRLFARIARTLRPGGCLLIESQPWRSYEEARRMGPEIRARMSGLQLRPEGDFQWILEGLGLLHEGRIGDGPGMGFVRQVEAFVKPHGPISASAMQMGDTLLGIGTDTRAGLPWVARYPRRGAREGAAAEGEASGDASVEDGFAAGAG
ncbi:uncharacterized protein PFL1_03381 [Pseudozyma flocculosa PF-1]|nr:uncharacterized protein PFL1_03381 [Pseudozyma flocculosa PF-1]EPQ29092.1 hypothetical protein PFL1_03381 [Pseudozyma flocculosa PF-1]